MAQRSRTARQRRSQARGRAIPTPQAPAKGARTLASGSAAPSPVTGSATASAADAAALVVSFTFDAGPAGGPPFDAHVRLTGRRRTGGDRPGKGDMFSRTETVHGVVPGSGRLAATSWVYHVHPGTWDVTTELIGPQRLKQATPDLHLPTAGWSWRRWTVEPVPPRPLETRWALVAPLARTPAVVPGSFFALALTAMVAAFAVQPLVFSGLGVDPVAGILSSLIGVVVGLAGAKAWYLGLKGPSWATLREGWSVDGFLVAAPLAALIAAGARGLEVGAYLDGVAPGIFVAVAIGRVGCFLTGCCAGRMTAGRGLVSSDRRVVARRVPSQLIESALGVVLVVLVMMLLALPVAGTGAVFVASMVVYVAGRQLLLRQRAERRTFSWRRAVAEVH